MNKRVAIIIAQKDFQDSELQDLKNVLKSRKVDCTIVSKTRHQAIGRFGIMVKPDLALAEIEVKNFDGLVFVGGIGSTQFVVDEVAHKLIHDFKKVHKVIAGSCLAPSILAAAGALIGKTATAFPTEEDNLKNKGADYTGMPVEVDGMVVTSKDPDDAKKLGEAVAYILEE